MALTRTVQEATGVPAGVYVARVKSLEEDDGQFGAQIKFYFEIQEVLASNDDTAEDYIGEEKWGWCSDKLTPNTKLFRWYRQLVGEDPDIDDVVDLTKMIGCQCRITISENKNGNLAITDLAAHTPKKSRRRRRPEPEPEPDPEGFDDDDDFDDEELEDF